MTVGVSPAGWCVQSVPPTVQGVWFPTVLASVSKRRLRSPLRESLLVGGGGSSPAGALRPTYTCERPRGRRRRGRVSRDVGLGSESGAGRGVSVSRLRHVWSGRPGVGPGPPLPAPGSGVLPLPPPPGRDSEDSTSGAESPVRTRVESPLWRGGVPDGGRRGLVRTGTFTWCTLEGLPWTTLSLPCRYQDVPTLGSSLCPCRVFVTVTASSRSRVESGAAPGFRDSSLARPSAPHSDL